MVELSTICPRTVQVLFMRAGEIDAADAIPSPAEFFVGVDCADARSFAEILRDAPHGHLGALVVERIAGGYGLSRLAVVDGKEAKIGVAHLAGHADAVLRMHDIARVDQVDGRGEVVAFSRKNGRNSGK